MMTSQPAPPVPPSMLGDAGHLLSLGFGAGLAPRAPGTFGTLAAVPVVLVWWLLDAGLWAQLATAVTLTVIGTWCAGRTAAALAAPDHRAIVVDEMAGLLITMCGAPASPWALAAGFGLFRLLDITKPWPISVADRRVHGGLGIMLDDVLAGCGACAGVQLARWLGWL